MPERPRWVRRSLLAPSRSGLADQVTAVRRATTAPIPAARRALVKTRSGGQPQLDPVALWAGNPAEPADTLHVALISHELALVSPSGPPR